jgi:DNA-binding HxlR family transcriptional regulator
MNEINLANKTKNSHKSDFSEVKDTIENPFQSTRLKTLEEDGYVRIIPDETNSYLYSAKLTKKGEALVRSHPDIPISAQDKLINE